MSSVPPPDIPGLRFITRLGSGGYSEVYLYEQQRPRMNVAVKVLTRPDLTDDVRRQFTAEGDAMAALADHPSIVQVFNADIAPDGRPYLVMKYYPNPNLGVRARSERLSIAEALRIGIEISSAVETAHRAGILHRDIKPANILISQFGAPGLTDFGIAASTLDAEGADGLSVPWAPPEVLYSHNAPDVRADVYALAATVWHLLVGRSPFEVPGGDNQSVALMRRILDQPAPRTGRADVPDSLDRLLQQALAKTPEGRPPTALAFARGLQAVEQESRLPLTQIVVPPSSQRLARESEVPEGPATRVKTPTRLQAQAPAYPTDPRPTAAPGPGAHGFGHDGFGIPAAPNPPGVSRRKLAVLVAAVVVVAAVIGVALVGTRRTDGGGGGGTTVAHSGGSGALDARPGQPAVAVTKQADGRYKFTWAWPQPAGNYYAQWHTQTDPSAVHSVDGSKPAQVVVSAKTAARCIVVIIVRRTDGTYSDPSDPVCGS